ncbi:MAG: hypothetical protein KDI46_07525 [Alphaproteobacteria bacterium]|nr:hypothetical protein [Alphaproteobacteria bacterium]
MKPILKITVLVCGLFLLVSPAAIAADTQEPDALQQPAAVVQEDEAIYPQAEGVHEAVEEIIEEDSLQGDAEQVAPEEHENAVHEEETHDAAHAGGHGEEAVGLPQFNPTSFPSQIFWLAVIFIVLYIFFSKKTLPEISSVIENRQLHIQNDLDMAEQLRDEAEKVHQAYDSILEEARKKSSDLFGDAEQEIKKNAEKSLAEFQARYTKDVEKTTKSLEAAKSKALGDVDSIVAQVASEAAEKIIGIKADKKSAENVVQSLQSKQAKAA